ncbi:RNA exonuclease 4-like [Pieris napi]|uniref:RNA exonuclease 4-like n=1 Tax=Pieris napi TaxID=78633 RepID=UPI001FB9081C|nr:RNA exonuclease 4-like [Pieris napi]
MLISFHDLLIRLLFIIDFVLNTVFRVFVFAYYIFSKLIHQVFNVNMVENNKKLKRNPIGKPNQTIVKRGVIDANWQKLMHLTTFMDKKSEKKEDTDKKESFKGTFRRDRKKKSNQQNNVANNMKTLKLNNKLTELDNDEVDNVKEETRKDKKNKLTKFIAMDCEMVGIGYNGDDHMIARVSLVNKFGDCIYDKFVKPREEVVDYRTSISGVRKEDLLNGEDFIIVQKEVSEILKGRIVVGHSLKTDLSVLFLSHPKKCIRDTSKYKPFRKITKGSTPSLKRLAKEILGIDIQHGEHSSVEDARATMQLYCTVGKTWEQALSEKRGYSRKFVET